MKKKLIIPTAIGIVIIVIILAIILLPKHKVDYQIAEKNTTTSQMEETIGSKPDSTTEENGMTINTYDHSIYMDYTGKMDYYYLQDKFMMSRWETECDSKEEMNNVYQNICENVTKDTGNGKTDQKQQCTIWTTEEKYVTVGCNVSADKEYTVYMVENQHQPETKSDKNNEPDENKDIKNGEADENKDVKNGKTDEDKDIKSGNVNKNKDVKNDKQ